MPVIHGSGMALVSLGAVNLADEILILSSHIGTLHVSAMKHPMAVTSRRLATTGTRRSGRRTASPRHAFAAVTVLRENQERSAENIQSNQTPRGDIPAVSPPRRSGVVRWPHEAFDEPETFPAATTPEESEAALLEASCPCRSTISGSRVLTAAALVSPDDHPA